MRIPVGTQTLNDSNAFLRALWAELRRRCGSCGWNYMPFKDSKSRKIFLGQTSIERPEGALSVSLGYNQRGSISEIEFIPPTDESGEDSPELREILATSVRAALERMYKPERRFLVTSVITLLARLGHYRGSNFAIVPHSNRECAITIGTYGFDDVDRISQADSILPQILDVLSVETNAFYVLGGESSNSQSAESPNRHFSPGTWSKGLPIADGALTITQEGFELLEALVTQVVSSKSVETFLRACSHFHTARRLDAQIHDRIIHGAPVPSKNGYLLPLDQRDQRLDDAALFGGSQNELAATLYMSALEVVATINAGEPERCKECGQLIYSIARRVRELVAEVAGEETAKSVSKCYGGRSKYLHVGVPISRPFHGDSTIPQLDADTASGCFEFLSIPIPLLRELTSYCLRYTLRKLIKVEEK